jgi:hypothetical protein
MAWWRHDKPLDAADRRAADEEDRRLRDTRMRERAREQDWARRPWFAKPAPPNPVFPIDRDHDGVFKKAGKGIANRWTYSLQVDLRRWAAGTRAATRREGARQERGRRAREAASGATGRTEKRT